jgi:hypothetical protein
LVEQEAVDGSSAYAPTDFLADVRKGVWKELDGPQVKIDAYRRNLQRAYLELVNTKINGAAQTLPNGLPASFAGLFATSGDEKPLYRAELKTLNASVSGALAKASDRETRAHLEGTRDQIAKILDPKFAPPAAGATGGIRIFGEQGDPFQMSPDQLGTCWPDYVIRP